MRDEYSDIQNSDVSAGEAKLRQLDTRDKILKIYQVFILVGLIIINTFGLFQIQKLIRDNQASTIEARKLSLARQDQIKGYIKCIILLRYDNPNLKPTSSKQEVEQALDRCADLTK